MITNIQLWNSSFIITQIQWCFRTAERTAYSHCPVLRVSIKPRLPNTWYRNNVAFSNIPKFILSLWSSKYQRLAPLNNSQINKTTKEIYHFYLLFQEIYTESLEYVILQPRTARNSNSKIPRDTQPYTVDHSLLEGSALLASMILYPNESPATQPSKCPTPFPAQTWLPPPFPS